ncbi:MobF family relaxase [Streptomyces sp. NPDC047973]|uniref:MobF family relaxase n=1 Tax=Streptomyces sp. NPDC047973 TaxID=3155383 RepID=UPI003441F8DD
MTAIRDAEQVEYRLKEQAGCSVVVPDDEFQETAGTAPEHRPREGGESALVWMGSGLAAVGLTEGAVLDDEGMEAARQLMTGCRPGTGARLIGTRTSARAHPSAKLPAARLVEAIEAAAAARGVAAGDLLNGKPKQQKVLAQQQRMVHRLGDRHRMQVTTLHKLARAVGLMLDDVYGAAELAEARDHAEERVDDRVRGWDLMLDLPKSDSTLAGLMPEPDQAEFRDLVHQATADTIREFERWTGYAVGSADGRPVRLSTGGLLAWSVEHLSARPMGDGRPGDPHLHLHVTIANMGLCEDGEWRSIGNSGQDLHRHAAAADAHFKARVRALTHARFGVRRQRAERTGAWEVDEVPELVRDLFSRRHGRIVDLAGDDAGRQDRDRAAAETLRAKHRGDASAMRDSWRERALRAGIDVDAMVAAAAPGPPGPDSGSTLDGPDTGPRVPPPADLAATVFHPETGLTSGDDTTFSRAQLLAAVGNALEFGPAGEQPPGDELPGGLDALVDDVLDVAGYAVRVPDYGSTVMTSTARYTTRDLLDAQDYVRGQAQDRLGEGGPATLTRAQADAAAEVFRLAAGFELPAEHGAVAARLLTTGHGIDTVACAAGTGRATLLAVCRIAWDARTADDVSTDATDAITYAVACPGVTAAQDFTRVSGMPAYAVEDWLRRISTGSGLQGTDVLVIDEATAVDNRSAAALVAEAARTGTRIIAFGDPVRLRAMAIGSGGWFRELHRLVEGPALSGSRRQEDAAERHALELWRTGDHGRALGEVTGPDRACIHPAPTADEARSRILTAWDVLRRDRWPDVHDLIDHLVLLAARAADAQVLNAGAQQFRRAAGELGAERTYALPGGDRLTLAVGDAVRVRDHEHRSARGRRPGPSNGRRAVVSRIAEDGRVEITWRDGNSAEAHGARASAWLTPEQIASRALSLGYALTVADSDGMVCDTNLLYGHGTDPGASYAGLNRGSEANHLWLPAAALENPATRSRLAEARTEAERLEVALEALARFLRRPRPYGRASARPGEQRIGEDRPGERPSRAVVPPPARTGHREAATTRPVPASYADDLRGRADRSARTAQAETPERELAGLVEESERAGIQLWNQRPYGSRTDQDLARLVAAAPAAALREERAAAEAAETERALMERIASDQARGESRGRRETSFLHPLLDRAEEQLRLARAAQARETAAAARAAKADELLRQLATADGKGRIALRLAGTSRREHRQLTQQATEQRADGWREASEARIAASRAAEAAWETLRSSPYAAVLGATDQQAPDTDSLAARLTEMRERRVPAHAQQIDTHDQKALSRAHGDVTRARKNAARHRAAAADASTEQTLRARIADQNPSLHEAETRARADHHVAGSSRAAAPAGPTYEPPTRLVQQFRTGRWPRL